MDLSMLEECAQKMCRQGGVVVEACNVCGALREAKEGRKGGTGKVGGDVPCRGSAATGKHPGKARTERRGRRRRGRVAGVDLDAACVVLGCVAGLEGREGGREAGMNHTDLMKQKKATTTRRDRRTGGICWGCFLLLLLLVTMLCVVLWTLSSQRRTCVSIFGR
jgi:hypothetical protein